MGLVASLDELVTSAEDSTGLRQTVQRPRWRRFWRTKAKSSWCLAMPNFAKARLRNVMAEWTDTPRSIAIASGE